MNSANKIHAAVRIQPDAVVNWAFGWEDDYAESDSLNVSDPLHKAPTILPRAMREREDWKRLVLPAPLLCLVSDEQLSNLEHLGVNEGGSVLPLIDGQKLNHLRSLFLGTDWSGLVVPTSLHELWIHTRHVKHGVSFLKTAEVERLALWETAPRTLDLVCISKLRTLELRRVKPQASLLARFTKLREFQLWNSGPLESLDFLLAMEELRELDLCYVYRIDNVEALIALPELRKIRMINVHDKTGELMTVLRTLKNRGVEVDPLDCKVQGKYLDRHAI